MAELKLRAIELRIEAKAASTLLRLRTAHHRWLQLFGFWTEYRSQMGIKIGVERHLHLR
jgi:hypothetical protein